MGLIFVLGANFIWYWLWWYFARTYPHLKNKYFPNGSAVYIPPSEFYQRATWAALHEEIWSDPYIRVGVFGIAVCFILFVVMTPLFLAGFIP